MSKIGLAWLFADPLFNFLGFVAAIFVAIVIICCFFVGDSSAVKQAKFLDGCARAGFSTSQCRFIVALHNDDADAADEAANLALLNGMTIGRAGK